MDRSLCAVGLNITRYSDDPGAQNLKQRKYTNILGKGLKLWGMCPVHVDYNLLKLS